MVNFLKIAGWAGIGSAISFPLLTSLFLIMLLASWTSSPSTTDLVILLVMGLTFLFSLIIFLSGCIVLGKRINNSILLTSGIVGILAVPIFFILEIVLSIGDDVGLALFFGITILLLGISSLQLKEKLGTFGIVTGSLQILTGVLLSLGSFMSYNNPTIDFFLFIALTLGVLLVIPTIVLQSIILLRASRNV